MSYCSVEMVRSISGLDNSEIRDERIRSIRDNVAVPRLNDDIQTRVDTESLGKVSDRKNNEFDGETEVFYLSELHDSFRALGDLNDDGEINSDDVKVWGYEGENEIDLVVDEIVDPIEGAVRILKDDNGSLVPLKDNSEVKVRYRHAPVDMSGPNAMVSIACAQLTGAFSFSNIETSKLKNFSIGDVTIRKQTEGFAIMKDQYKESMQRIVNRELIQFDENENSIEDVIKKRYAGDQPLGQGKETTGRFWGG